MHATGFVEISKCILICWLQIRQFKIHDDLFPGKTWTQDSGRVPTAGKKWVMASVSGIVYQELQPAVFDIQVLNNTHEADLPPIMPCDVFFL